MQKILENLFSSVSETCVSAFSSLDTEYSYNFVKQIYLVYAKDSFPKN